MNRIYTSKSWPYKSHSYKISTSFIHTLMFSLSLSLSLSLLNTNRMQCINSTLWEWKSRTSKSQLLGLWWYSTTNSIKDVFRIVTLTPNQSFLIFNYGMDQNGPQWIKVDKNEPNRQNWPESTEVNQINRWTKLDQIDRMDQYRPNGPKCTKLDRNDWTGPY